MKTIPLNNERLSTVYVPSGTGGFKTYTQGEGTLWQRTYLYSMAIKKLLKKNNYTDRQKSRPIYRSTIGRLSTKISNDYLLTIDQVSTHHRSSVDQLLTDTSVKNRPTIGEVSAKSRRSVGEVSVYEKLYWPRYIWNDDRLSTVSRPTVDRLSTVILICRYYLQ